MSEYVFGYMLAHERRLLERFASQQTRQWDPAPPGTLRDKTIGLIGVGSIGAALARTAKHFGMRVKGCTRSSEDCADVDAFFHAPDTREFAGDLDYLVTVAPNTMATRRIVNAALLAQLPRQAVFINPGRGQIVDELALMAALHGGLIAGAVLDVFEDEPLPEDHPLWRTPRVLITSHTAAISQPPDVAPVFADNYRRFVEGQPLKYVVDFDREY